MDDHPVIAAMLAIGWLIGSAAAQEAEVVAMLIERGANPDLALVVWGFGYAGWPLAAVSVVFLLVHPWAVGTWFNGRRPRRADGDNDADGAG